MRSYFVHFLIIIVVASCDDFFKATPEEVNVNSPRLLVTHSVIKPDCLITAHIDITTTLDSLSYSNPNALRRLSESTVVIKKNGALFDTLKYVQRDGYTVDYNFFQIGIWERVFFKGSKRVLYNPSDTYRIEVSSSGLPSVFSETSLFQTIEGKNIQFKPNLRRIESNFWYHEIIATVDTKSSNKYYVVALTDLTYRAESWIKFNVNIPIQEQFLQPEPELPPPSIFDNWPYRSLAFPASLLPDGDDNFKMSFTSFYYTEPPTNGSFGLPDLFVLYAVDQDYYDYVLSVNLQHSLLFSPLTEPVPIESNITNGFGVFGSAVPIVVQPLTPIGEAYLSGEDVGNRDN